MNQDIVDAHSDEIDAYVVMLVELKCKFELGADAISTRNEHRMLVMPGDFEQCTKSAYSGKYLGTQGACGKRFDVLNQLIACIDIDAGISIGQGSGLGMI